MSTNIPLKRVLGNHLDKDSGVQKIKGMFFINKDSKKSINLIFTKFWRISAFSPRKLPLNIKIKPEKQDKNNFHFFFLWWVYIFFLVV